MTKNLKISLIILGILIGLYLIDQNSQSKYKSTSQLIFSHDKDQINKFLIQNGNEAIELTKEQAEKHDQIFYHEARATLEDKELGEGVSKHWDKMQKLLDWFRGDKKNIKAYMVLLD